LKTAILIYCQYYQIEGLKKKFKKDAILRAVEECPMKTPFEMLDWAKNNINGVQFGCIEISI
jgi:hypothetical protein